MDKASAERLIQQMKAAIDLETAVAAQNVIIQSYIKKTDEMKPELHSEPHPGEPQKPEYQDPQFEESWRALLMGLGVILILIGAVGIIAGITEGWASFGRGQSVYYCMSLIIGLICIIPFLKKRSDIKRQNDAKQTEYEKQMIRWKEKVSNIDASNEKLRIDLINETEAWLNSKSRNLEELQKILNHTKELLIELYMQDFIYYKYRNLPALTRIYEYFITGRCDELTGPHGAYNLYEDEVRKDMVISQIGQDIENLEEIEQTQSMRKIMQWKTEPVRREIAEIRDYTGSIMELSAVNAYYSALTARNTEISATMHLLNG